MCEFLEFFFSKKFWLPPNVDKWPPNDVNNFPVLNDIFIYPFVCAVILYYLRFTFEKLVAIPIGIYFGIKTNNQQINVNSKQLEILEKYYQQSKNPPESILNEITKESSQSYEIVKQWFEVRRDNPPNKPSKMKKFTETTWRFTFYFFVFTYGLIVLFDKPWFTDVRQCWLNYPFNELEKEIYWYYMIEMGFYLSLVVSQFKDVRRKDFWEMFFHHIITIALLMFSFVENHTRIGSLILVLHDSVDFWLELAKMAKYANKQSLCDFVFAIFAILWFITRLIIFPFKIIYSSTFEGSEIIGFYPAYHLFNFFLYFLQILHVIWFYMICKVAYKAIIIGKVEKDDRSESDASSNHEKQQ